MFFDSGFLYIKAIKENSSQKHFFRHKVQHFYVKIIIFVYALYKRYMYTEKDAQGQLIFSMLIPLIKILH